MDDPTVVLVEKQVREVAAAMVVQTAGHPLGVTGEGVTGADMLRVTAPIHVEFEADPRDTGRWVDCHALVPLSGDEDARVRVVEEQLRETLEADRARGRF